MGNINSDRQCSENRYKKEKCDGDGEYDDDWEYFKIILSQIRENRWRKDLRGANKVDLWISERTINIVKREDVTWTQRESMLSDYAK